jgi:hypothetical protein
MSHSGPDAKLSSLDARVSLFHGSTDTTVYDMPSLTTVLEQIHDGTYRHHIERLRHLLATGTTQSYKRAKATSVAFTPCCALTTRDKDTSWEEKLLSCTGLVHLDIDELDDPEALKAQLLQHPSLVFAFTSPSGKGLKLGYAATPITGPEDYKQAWQHSVTLLKDVHPSLTITEDRHVKYLHALCYVSWDPHLYLTSDAQPLMVPPPAPPQRPPFRPSRSTSADYARVADALRFIANADTDYDTWLTLGMALHSSGEPWARDLWDDWSRQSSKYNERKQSTSWKSFSSGKTTLGTLFYLAKQGGWRPPARETLPPRRTRPVPDMTQPPPPDPDDPDVQTGFLAHRLPEYLRDHPDPRVRRRWARIYQRTNALKRALAAQGALP